MTEELGRRPVRRPSNLSKVTKRAFDISMSCLGLMVTSPVLLVVGSYLGTLSHTLTTVAAIQGRGIGITGVVVDESDDNPVPVIETVETLARFLPGVKIAAVTRNAGPAAVYAALGPMIGA